MSTPMLPGGPTWEVAPLGRRIGARLLNGVFGLVMLALLIVPALLFPGGSGRALMGLVLLAWFVGVLNCELRHAATPGQLALGMCQLDAQTGQPAGGRTFLKYFLMGVLTQLSCGVMGLLALFTYTGPQSRSWWDRMAGVVVVQPSSTPVAKATHDSPRDLEALPQQSPRALDPVVEPVPAALVTPVAAPEVRATPPSWAVLAPVEGATVVEAARDARTPVPVRVHLDDATTVDLDRPHVLGRDPVAPSHCPDAVPLAVSDPERSLSKTHLLIERGPVGMVVTDLHSTNGVSILAPDGRPTRATPGQPTRVPEGGSVRYGSRSLRTLT